MDLLHIANAVSRARMGKGVGAQFIGSCIGEITTASGIKMESTSSWMDHDVDVVVLPSLAMPFLDPRRRPSGLSEWVRRQHQLGALVLAITTGSWLLADTGLLAGHAAATHWACLDLCRSHFPDVVWSADQRVALAESIVTARDAIAAVTAVCHIVGRFSGSAVAERTYEYSLIRAPGEAALPLLRTVALRQHQDGQVLKVQEWLETHYAEDRTAFDLARMVHLSPRSLRRRFREATGMTLLSYRAEVRLARARALLLSTNETVSQISLAVGYENVSTFIALFRKSHGKTPVAYRKDSARALL